MDRRIIAAVVSVIVVASATGVLLTRTQQPTTPDPKAQVNSRFSHHLLALESKNVSVVLRDYEGNATVQWSGNSQGLSGAYHDSNNISLLYAAFVSHMTNLTLTNMTSAVSVSGDRAIVNAHINITGNSLIFGTFSAIVNAEVHYVDVSGRWLITDEAWYFASFLTKGLTSLQQMIFRVEALSVSPDDSCMAVGTAHILEGGPGSSWSNGSLYLLSPQGEILWHSHYPQRGIGVVAVSANCEYTVAGLNGGREGEVYLFDRQGNLLWNLTTGASGVSRVAISDNGSNVAVEVNRGILYLNNAGRILWNYTTPGVMSGFAMSSDGAYLAVSAFELPGPDLRGWAVFYWNSKGTMLWHYPENGRCCSGGIQPSALSMSKDGSYLAVGEGSGLNGTVYYFNRIGALLWQRHSDYTVTNIFVSPTGSYLVAGANGVVLFNLRGDILWNDTGRVGPPVGISPDGSSVLLSGAGMDVPQIWLLGAGGGIVANYSIPGLSYATAMFHGSNDWITGGVSEGCPAVYLYEGWSVVTVKLC